MHSFGAFDIHRREYTLGKAYVFVAGMMTFARPWEKTPYTLSGRIAFMRQQAPLSLEI